MSSNYTHRSVPEVLADNLERDIRLGVWVDTLPGYRKLAEHYRASQRSAAAALKILETKSLIQSSSKGNKRKILSATQINKERPSKLMVVAPSSLKENATAYPDLNLEQIWRESLGSVTVVQVGMSTIQSPQAIVNKWLTEHRPDAILVWIGTKVWLSSLVDTGLPVFCMGGEVSDVEERISGCGYSVEDTLKKILRKFRAMGHTRILFPDRLTRPEISIRRAAAYKSELGDLYHEKELEVFYPQFYQSVAEVWPAYWKKALIESNATAVICENVKDLLSLYGFCNSCKITIPQDLSVITLAEGESVEWLAPSITRMRFSSRKATKHFKRWIDSGFLLRDFRRIDMTWEEGSSVRDLVGSKKQ